MPTLRQAAKDDITLIHELACQAFPATYRDLLSREQIDFMMDWMYPPASHRKGPASSICRKSTFCPASKACI